MLLLWVILATSYGEMSGQTKANSGEAFINEIFNKVADSTLSRYYLLSTSVPCSFKRFDFDEWMKYGLKEKVPFEILNELAKNAFLDKTTSQWDQSKLLKAICIPGDQAKAILSCCPAPGDGHPPAWQPGKKALLSQKKAWEEKPREERMVFCFSKPAFTADSRYAVIDVAFRCDDKACGMGSTYIFRREGQEWIIAGEMIAWAN